MDAEFVQYAAYPFAAFADVAAQDLTGWQMVAYVGVAWAPAETLQDVDKQFVGVSGCENEAVLADFDTTHDQMLEDLLRVL